MTILLKQTILCCNHWLKDLYEFVYICMNNVFIRRPMQDKTKLLL